KEIRVIRLPAPVQVLHLPVQIRIDVYGRVTRLGVRPDKGIPVLFARRNKPQLALLVCRVVNHPRGPVLRELLLCVSEDVNSGLNPPTVNHLRHKRRARLVCRSIVAILLHRKKNTRESASKLHPILGLHRTTTQVELFALYEDSALVMRRSLIDYLRTHSLPHSRCSCASSCALHFVVLKGLHELSLSHARVDLSNEWSTSGILGRGPRYSHFNYTSKSLRAQVRSLGSRLREYCGLTSCNVVRQAGRVAV